MSESVTISKKTPGSKSQQYEFLREEAIKYVQRVAGKIWTDYNIHDPGVTILEVLAYAITELGYRADYIMEDLLENNPNDENSADIRNFFTARQILPNCPVTINDYRKLLIDVDIYNLTDTSCKHIGVKNAWIEKSKMNEIPVYVHKKESKLDFMPDPEITNQLPLEIGILYDILLEFEKCEKYGDLNENSITKSLVIQEHLPDSNVEGLTIKIAVEFPRWDSENTDWNELGSIKSGIQKIVIRFSNIPGNYEFYYELVNNIVKLKGTVTTASDVVPVPGLADIENQINDFIYYGEDSLLALYLQKIDKINAIIKEVKARLNANRNMCEDFYHLNALKVEKIAVCADIELEQDADVEKVQAEIHHEIAKFLSPTVFFYSLDEMLDKCRKLHELNILKTDVRNSCFEVGKNLSELLKKDDTISITGSRSNDGDYTVESVAVDPDSSATKIYVTEEISSELLTEGEILSFYVTNENECLSVDEIFEGPALEHGFIDNDELEKADRKKFIHVSDLIQIIMDVEDVVSVKTIQIANIPQDNEDGAIESVSVKWCLQLAFEQNYVPRLSMLDSKITFFKDQLPFRAASSKVETLINELEADERSPKLYNPVLDFEIPKGTYRDLESYQSIQNEFPLTYGIGDEGLPLVGKNEADNIRREASARQIKGYLMHFDQLLANFFSQLAHVKDLFSMNAEKVQFGNYKIGRTYYTQPLFEIVPDADELYVDKNGHAATLNAIAENDSEFFVRKNKFLDHLTGRFAEQFTDYALLTFKISGELIAPEELVADKLAFLNSYPAISSSRGKGFNHQAPCKLWHVDNISGLRRRTSFLVGIDEPKVENIHFSSGFEIFRLGDSFVVRVTNAVPELLLNSYEGYESENEAKLLLEKMILNGLDKDNYKVLSEDGGINYYFTLDCGGYDVLGISEKEDYPDNMQGGELDQDIDELVQLFANEFYQNMESNRNNLACAVLNYLQFNISVNLESNPPEAVVSFDLFAVPFSTDAEDKLLTGQYIVEGIPKSEVDIISVDTGLKQLIIDGNIAEKLEPGAVLVIEDSEENDGIYTVVSAADTGGNTEIIVNETIASDATPLGEMLYNNETEQSLLEKAENQLSEIFWQLIKNASQEGKYYFSADSGAYRFILFNNYGIDLAESVESDFNEPLSNEIENLSSGKVKISESSGNDGEYVVSSAFANGEDVTVTLTGNLPSATNDGKINFSETFTYSVNKENNTFTIQTDITGKIFEGNSMQVSNSVSIDGDYTIISIQPIASETVITVKEPIPAEDNSGNLTYFKSFSINKVTANTITFKGGYELKAVQLFIRFITEKFFSHEGLHIVEHILLRPKVKGEHFTDADEETLTDGLAEKGSLCFFNTISLFSASSTTNLFRVEGNLTNDLGALESSKASNKILISGTGVNDADYQVKSVQYDAGTNRSSIKITENIPSDIPFSDAFGTLSYMKCTPIENLSAAGLTITVSEPLLLQVLPGEVVEIRGSTDNINDRRYMVKEIIDHGSTQEIIINRVETKVEDSLLSIVLDEDDCDACQIKDPYSFVASVILPHWQGRFDNMDFRRFFERQLRLEAPAHVFLVICWISCEHMAEFELKYKAWLVENAKKQKDYGSLSGRLKELVDVISRLRNVYPSGTLHDCEEDETLENAIILNNSVLGNA